MANEPKSSFWPVYVVVVVGLVIAVLIVANNDNSPASVPAFEPAASPVIDPKIQRDADLKQLTPRARTICEKHSDWDAESCADISKGKVHIGMTADQVRASWGKPEEINRDVGSFGVHEQCVYAGGDQLLYIDSGVLTSFQDDSKK